MVLIVFYLLLGTRYVEYLNMLPFNNIVRRSSKSVYIVMYTLPETNSKRP